MYLNVVKTKGSSGKCWVFHINEEGNFKGYLFPSGFRILGIKSDKRIKGEFFLENRNFVKSRYGLLGAVLPKTPAVGQINKCEMILITKLYIDEKGDMCLKFHRYLSHKGWKTNLKNLMEAGTMNDYFSGQDKVPVKSLRLAYMNSFLNLVPYKEGYQMKEEGPDSYVINYKRLKLVSHWNGKKTYSQIFTS